MNPWIVPFQEELEKLDRIGAQRVFTEELSRFTPIQMVEQVVVPAVERIGAAWALGDVALSQVYMSGRICEELVEQVLPPSDPAASTSRARRSSSSPITTCWASASSIR
jgi:methanogenic corrinoid protein MtbC1